MNAQDPLVIGLDIATRNVRAVAVTPDGHSVTAGHAHLANVRRRRPGWATQDARSWWPAAAKALAEVTQQLGNRTQDIAAIAVAATSGTVVPTDHSGEPTGPALMYDDRRAEAQARRVQQIGHARWTRLGIRITPTFALPKVAWILEHSDTAPDKIRHPSDLITWKLAGTPTPSDWSHCLKTGYDPVARQWPNEVLAELCVPDGLLPPVQSPTSQCGTVCPSVADLTGLPTGCPIRLAMTDGCAAQLATGATDTGDFVTVLGTTLVLKGVADTLIKDPGGVIYSHHHPDGYWMPGGASNTGGEALTRWHDDNRSILPELDRAAVARGPSSVTSWPLRREGERFPIYNPDARGFVEGEPEDDVDAYRADLEGVAYLERLAYERLRSFGAGQKTPIRTAGGGATSTAWACIRASVLGEPVTLVDRADTVLGAAILAAAGTMHPTLSQAAINMTPVATQVDPHPGWRDPLEEGYARFLCALRKRRWL